MLIIQHALNFVRKTTLELQLFVWKEETIPVMSSCYVCTYISFGAGVLDTFTDDSSEQWSIFVLVHNLANYTHTDNIWCIM